MRGFSCAAKAAPRQRMRQRRSGAAAGVLAVLTAVIVATAATAQRAAAQVIAPPAFAATEGEIYQYAITQVGAWTYQVQYAAAQLSGLTPGQQITGLRFRVDNTLATTPQTLTYSDYTVQLSQATNPITGMSTTFAANQLNPVTVYDAPLTFDAADMPTGSFPNAFGPTITFATPYTYQGGDLVLYFTHSVSSTGSENGVGMDATLVQNTETGYRAFIQNSQNAATANGTTATIVITQFVTTANAAPEPAAAVLFATGLLPVLGAVVRRQRRPGK
jgi:hypothetical protein